MTCSYIPPSSPQLVYIEHANVINFIAHSAKPNDLVIAVGDFNMPSIKWIYSSDDGYYIPSTSNNNLNSYEFINLLSDSNLSQLNGILNEYGKMLDLVFINECNDIVVKRCEPIINPEDRYHPALEINISILNDIPESSIRNEKSFCFNKANYYMLNSLLTNINWNDVLMCPNISMDDIVDRFYSTIFSIIDLCIPKEWKRELSGPLWNTKYLSSIKNKKIGIIKNTKNLDNLLTTSNIYQFVQSIIS